MYPLCFSSFSAFQIKGTYGAFSLNRKCIKVRSYSRCDSTYPYVFNRNQDELLESCLPNSFVASTHSTGSIPGAGYLKIVVAGTLTSHEFLDLLNPLISPRESDWTRPETSLMPLQSVPGRAPFLPRRGPAAGSLRPTPHCMRSGVSRPVPLPFRDPVLC